MSVSPTNFSMPATFQSQDDRDNWVRQLQEKYNDAESRGLLGRYEKELRIFSEIFTTKTYPNKIAHQKLCHLFLIAIDPLIAPEVKMELISIKPFPFKLLAAPPIMGINILRYCDEHVWENDLFNPLNFNSIEVNLELREWLSEVINSKWPTKEKIFCLEKIYSHWKDACDQSLYQPAKLDENVMLIEFLRYAPTEEIAELLYISDRLAKVTEEASSAMFLRIQYPNERMFGLFYDSHQDVSHLDIFYKFFLGEPNASLVAFNFDNKDWKWFLNKMQNSYDKYPQIVTHITRWMVDILDRLNKGTLPVESSQIPTFLSNASNIIDKLTNASNIIDKLRSSWSERNIKENYLDQILPLLSIDVISRYFLRFSENLQQEIIQHLMKNDPRAIILWMEMIFKGENHDAINDTSRLIDKFKGHFESLIPILFDKQCNSPTFMLSVFSSLNKEQMEVVLRYLLDNRIEGVALLTQWFELCLKTDSELHPDVKNYFTMHLFALLNKIDPTISCEIKEKLDASSIVQATPMNQEFVNIVLPIGQDLNNPQVRQTLAIQKMKHCLLTPKVSPKCRNKMSWNVTNEMRDLKVPRAIWLPLLNESLPKENLHFIIY